jgi:hypothetical protein
MLDDQDCTYLTPIAKRIVETKVLEIVDMPFGGLNYAQRLA